MAQRATKALSFGLLEVQEDQHLNNAERILQEYADLVAVMEMLEAGGHISLDQRNGPLRSMIEAKKQKVEKYLLYSAKCGTLSDHHCNPDHSCGFCGRIL